MDARSSPCASAAEGGHIHLLFADFIRVLLFPSLALRRFELGGGEAPFLSHPDAEIFFLRLVLPRPVLVEWTHSQQNMGITDLLAERIIGRLKQKKDR